MVNWIAGRVLAGNLPTSTATNALVSRFSVENNYYFTGAIKAGFGLNYSLSSRVSLIFQFNHHFLNNDIIDKNLAGDILRNEFVRTTNNWSTFTSGINLKFGRERVWTQIDPVRDDFQVVSTVSPNQSLVSDEQTSELSDSLDRRQSETDTTEIELPSTPAALPFHSTLIQIMTLQIKLSMI